MAADSDDDGARRHPSPSSPEGRSCRGLLYFSSLRKASGRNPICVGFSRPQDQVRNYPKSEQEIMKDGKALLDFKYACLGYSIHRNQTARTESETQKHGELPFCMGIEMMAERRSSSQGSTVARQEHLNQKSDQTNEAAPIMPRPPSSIRPGPQGTGKGFPVEEFSTRFMRSAGLITAAIGKNLARLGNSIKAMAEDIIHPDRSRPK